MPVPDRNRVVLLLAAASAHLMLWTAAEASSVKPMTVETLADHSGQVVVGTVASVRSYWATDPRRIESEITLAEVEYLKGRLPGSQSTFSFIAPGGEVDEVRMTVCCAPEFQVGEKWILFLLPSYRTYPVVGIYQGAFLVRPDEDGIERIVSRRHGREEPVTGIDSDGFIQHGLRGGGRAPAHVLQTRNVRVLTPAETTGARPAVSYEDFVTRLRPVLQASRDHKLTEPAGRRILVEYRAVPLQPSRLQRALDEANAGQPARDLPRGLDAAIEEHATPRASGSPDAEVTP